MADLLGLVYARSYKTEKGTMVACCDKELLGKIFREGKLKLSLQTNFYGNATVDLLEALVLLDGADILNLVGENIVRAAIEKGLVHPHAVISIVTGFGPLQREETRRREFESPPGYHPLATTSYYGCRGWRLSLR